MKEFKERFEEIKEIYKKLNDLGLNIDINGIKEFKVIANDFVKNSISASGKIKIPEIGRELIYILSTQSHIVSYVSLKHL